MSWLWYADRSTALVAFVALWFAVLTGIFHGARALGFLHRASRTVHVGASVVASVAVLMHVALGSFDTWLVLTHKVPHPRYTDAWFLAGVGIGLTAFLVTLTSVLAFLDAKKFQRPYEPRTVHAFAYGGFVFAALHAVAVGSDMGTFVRTGILAATLYLLVALVLRVLVPALHPAGEQRSRNPP